MKVENYSQIINSEDYNNLMNNQHLYIREIDKKIVDYISKNYKENVEIVELGCGPGRLTELLAQIPNSAVTGIDTDKNFLKFAKNKEIGADFKLASVMNYIHKKPVDVFVSQGMHHHIPKGKETKTYLENIAKQLNDGIYIVGDEFLPNYKDEEERQINAIVWYSHIIGEALNNNYAYLAQEEAKTLLDDIFIQTDRTKTQEHIEYILENAQKINSKAKVSDKNVYYDASKTLETLLSMNINNTTKNLSMSRGDFKVSKEVFLEEIGNVRFIEKDYIRCGPKADIGELGAFILST